MTFLKNGSRSKLDMTNAEKYVRDKRDLDAQWSNLTAEERAEANVGLKWLTLVGEIYTGPKLRGRPPGAKNKQADVPKEEVL